nr:uncharacterized protein LOC112728443 isoform X2 [Arachis hypogaea]
MAASLVEGAFLSSFLNVLFDRLSDDKFVNWIRGKKLDQDLRGMLENILNVVEAVLNDAEKKQITHNALKRWLKNLQDADDLLDEVCAKAATQKDPRWLPRKKNEKPLHGATDKSICTIFGKKHQLQ